MHPIFKSVLAVLAGIIIASCGIVLFEKIIARIYPADTLQPSVEQMEAYIRKAPFIALGLVVLGYIVSSFLGGYVAGRIAAPAHKLITALFVGVFLLLGGLVNFISISHPLWMSAASCISFILFAYWGGSIAKRLSSKP